MSESPESPANLIDAIYQTSLNPQSLIELFPLIEEHLNCFTSNLMIVDAGSNYIGGAHHGFSTWCVDAYVNHFIEHDQFVKSYASTGTGVIISDTDFDEGKVAAEKFDRSYYYNEFVKVAGVRHVIGTTLQLFSDRTLIFSSWRESGAGAFDAGARSRFDGVTRHLARSIDIARHIEKLQGELAVSDALRGEASTSVIHLNSSGKVCDASPGAARLIAEADGLTLRRDRVVATLGTADAALQRLIDTALSPTRALGGILGPIAIPRGNGRAPLIVKLVAIPRPQLSFLDVSGESRTDALLIIEDQAGRSSSASERLSMLGAAFGLTPAELKLLRCMLGSRNLREATERAGVKYETGRTQVKSIFGKTGTSSQLDLVRLVDRFPGIEGS